jgi:hypothetical protein
MAEKNIWRLILRTLNYAVKYARKDMYSLFLQFVKCGFAGANFPTAIFPSLVGRPILRSEETVEGVEIKVRRYIARVEP